MPTRGRELLIVYLPKPIVQFLREDARRNGDIPSRALERMLEGAGFRAEECRGEGPGKT